MSSPKLEDTPMYQIYLLEAIRLVEEISTGIGQLESYWSKQKPQGENARSVLIVDPEVQKNLHVVISDVARLSNLIRYEPKQGSSVTFSSRRVSFFRKLFPFKITAIHSRAARNSLEHFEERIDKENHDRSVKGAKQSGFIYACMFSDANALNAVSKGRETFIRVFVFEEMSYINYKAEISLRAVNTELEQMKVALAQFMGTIEYEKANIGGGILRPPAPEGGLTPVR